MLLLVLSFVCNIPIFVGELTRDNRVVGGMNATIEQYPYQAGVMWRETYVCSGAIIRNDVIITAAQCTHQRRKEDLNVWVGSTDQYPIDLPHYVKGVIAHHLFNYTSLEYDIALLVLYNPLEFNERVQPINLPLINEDWSTGTNGTVTGWGATAPNGNFSTNLQAVVLPVYNLANCKDIYGFMNVTLRMFCVGFEEGGKGACTGDVGSPFNINGIVAGVASWSRGCAEPHFPTVYSHVGFLRKFIYDSLRI